MYLCDKDEFYRSVLTGGCGVVLRLCDGRAYYSSAPTAKQGWRLAHRMARQGAAIRAQYGGVRVGAADLFCSPWHWRVCDGGRTFRMGYFHV